MSSELFRDLIKRFGSFKFDPYSGYYAVNVDYLDEQKVQILNKFNQLTSAPIALINSSCVYFEDNCNYFNVNASSRYFNMVSNCIIDFEVDFFDPNDVYYFFDSSVDTLCQQYLKLTFENFIPDKNKGSVIARYKRNKNCVELLYKPRKSWDVGVRKTLTSLLKDVNNMLVNVHDPFDIKVQYSQATDIKFVLIQDTRYQFYEFLNRVNPRTGMLEKTNYSLGDQLNKFNNVFVETI